MGEDAMHTTTETTFTPAKGDIQEMSQSADMKYVGTCPAGVDPGDSILPDGKVVKALEL
jgi:hypothetical protein